MASTALVVKVLSKSKRGRVADQKSVERPEKCKNHSEGVCSQKQAEIP